MVNPEYSVYIISKGRWETRLTSRIFERMSIPYYIVIEPQEYDNYSTVIDPGKILVLPFSDLGLGSIPARNWVWEYSISMGEKRHWIVDDNIKKFWRWNNNSKVKVDSGAIFKAMEDFVDRYENIAIAGPNYYMFVPSKIKWNPFRTNTRIYSCILIKNDIPYRWRGRYNEDTDLSLRVLKDGWCTILFLAFLSEKSVTMTMKGGNTEALYKLNNGQDGRFLMAQSLQRQHPDVVKITRKWGRWQHQVDYRPFKGNKLIKKEGVIIPEGINNYGMVLINRKEESDHAPDPCDPKQA